MDQTEAARGYVIREATLIIDQPLTEPQLRELEARLGIDQQPRRFRPDAREFQFPLAVPASGDPLDHPAVVYARVHELAHRIETYATLTREQQVLGTELQPGDVVFLVRESGPGEDLALDPRPPEWYALLREVELGFSSDHRRFEVDGGYVELHREGYYQRRTADTTDEKGQGD